MDAIDLCCGTGYVPAWMARRGATVTAIDNSQRQLETARRLAIEHRLDITWLNGNAEQVPRPDDSYDFAVSEYGAAIWCDPFIWIPEAHRLLRPGGMLAFFGIHPLALACTPLDGSPTSGTWCEIGSAFTASTGGRWRAIRAASSSLCPRAAGSACLTALVSTSSTARNCKPRYPGAGKPFGTPAGWAHCIPSEHIKKVRKRG